MTGPDALEHVALDTRLGRVVLAASAHGLALVVLDERGLAERLTAWRAAAARHAPEDVTGESPGRDPGAVLELARAQLGEYADGRRTRFELPLDLRGTAFQRAVWAALLAIPHGATRTYGDVARAAGRPGAVRAAGTATGANPAPIVVPCHRVVAKDGLGGFSAGLAWKRTLLHHESVLLWS